MFLLQEPKWATTLQRWGLLVGSVQYGSFKKDWRG